MSCHLYLPVCSMWPNLNQTPNWYKFHDLFLCFFFIFACNLNYRQTSFSRFANPQRLTYTTFNWQSAVIFLQYSPNAKMHDVSAYYPPSICKHFSLSLSQSLLPFSPAINSQTVTHLIFSVWCKAHETERRTTIRMNGGTCYSYLVKNALTIFFFTNLRAPPLWFACSKLMHFFF